ncbi:hypothetical protein BGW39_005459 [Mortierella sp. 14UC]|nr:hypothetical protein BGW39_005459 [Mortierella sp. 14UC]
MVVVQSCPPYPALEIPEIRNRLTSHLDRKDCLSCIRVSRDWFQYFVRPIWHTIDFYRDATAFSKVTPNVLDKYGGFISRAVNISDMDHLQALQHSKVDALKFIKAQVSVACVYQQILSDIIHRCEGSLQSIDIFSEPSEPDTLVEQRKHGRHYFNTIYAISSPPKSKSAEGGTGLTTLMFTRLCISREEFSSLLRRCPNLREMTLHQVLLFGHAPSLTLFTGSKLRCLVASFAQVWDLDPQDLSGPSLLAYFPLLEKWHVPSLDRSPNASLAVMRHDISHYCPVLKDIRFDRGDPATASALLANTFKILESCTLSTQVLAASTVLGLVAHRDSLTSISITKIPTDLIRGSDALCDALSVQWLYMIPRLCHRLQVLSLGSFVCEIDEIENHDWVCADLRELRICVRGLTSAQNVEACLKQVCVQRRACGADVTRPRKEETTVGRVAQHLLQFKHLKTVCLGTQVYYLPSLSS